MITGQLVGLAVSVVAYFAGVSLFLRLQASRIQALPAEWRQHPALRERYDAAVNRGVRSVLASRNRASLGWLAGFIVTFAVLAAANLTLRFELIFIAALALWWTIAEYQRNVSETERLRAEHGLPDARPGRWRTVRRLARWIARFIVWAGFLGTACFVGGLLAAPLR
jgi:hypothetical protein